MAWGVAISITRASRSPGNQQGDPRLGREPEPDDQLGKPARMQSAGAIGLEEILARPGAAADRNARPVGVHRPVFCRKARCPLPGPPTSNAPAPLTVSSLRQLGDSPGRFAASSFNSSSTARRTARCNATSSASFALLQRAAEAVERPGGVRPPASTRGPCRPARGPDPGRSLLSA